MNLISASLIILSINLRYICDLYAIEAVYVGQVRSSGHVHCPCCCEM